MSPEGLTDPNLTVEIVEAGAGPILVRMLDGCEGDSANSYHPLRASVQCLLATLAIHDEQIRGIMNEKYQAGS